MPRPRSASKQHGFNDYVFGLLLCLELILSFTGLGYIHAPPISVTIAYLPVLAAALLLGPVSSTAMGVVFGLASIYKASASYVLAGDRVFSPFVSGAPLASLVLSLGTRALFGLLVGLSFAAVKKLPHARAWLAVCAALAPTLHALLVYSALAALFPALGYTPMLAVPLQWKDLVVALIAVTLVDGLWLLFRLPAVQQLRKRVDQANREIPIHPRIRRLFTLFELGTQGVALAATFYIHQRMTFMLERHQVAIDPAVSGDLFRLQIQFLLIVLTLNWLAVILLELTYQYMSSREYECEIDALTGVMGRRLFLHRCRQVWDAPAGQGWFLFLDVDHFKTVNDTLGHPVGDQVLQSAGALLRDTFADLGLVGRVGGDEFAVLIDSPLPRAELEAALDRLQEQLSLVLPDMTISFSIGVQAFTCPCPQTSLLTAADNALYQAKARGRACYVVQEETAGIC